MISHRDLKLALQGILDGIRHIRTPDRLGQEAFYGDRDEAARKVLNLMDRVDGVGPSTTAPRLTSAEIRDAARTRAPDAATAAAAVFTRR